MSWAGMERGGNALRVLLGMLVVLASLPLSAGAQGGPPPKRHWNGVVPRLESAEAQFRHARALKTRRFTLPDRERRRASERAIEAYRAVREYFPRAGAVASEAAFRAAQLLAAEGRTKDARREYEEADRLGEGCEFRARARLEIGRILRRDGHNREALDRFYRVAGDPKSSPVRRSEAWLEVGDIFALLGKTEESERAWRTVTQTARDARHRIEAYDRLGRSLLGHGDIEGAAGVLAECRTALHGHALLETEDGARVRRALATMRLPRALAEAIEERREGGAPERTF